MLEIILSFLAGILTIAAPCILLPLPIILGGSVGQSSKTRPLFITLGFVLTFAVLGISLNYLVQSLGLDPNTLRTGAVVLLALFAIFLIWPTPFERLTSSAVAKAMADKHFSNLINASRQGSSGNIGGLILGIILGIIWAPCAGPILGSILTLIAQQTDILRAALLLTAYSVGAGVPMLIIAYGGQALTTKIRSFARYGTRLQQIFGVILIFVAAAVYFQYDTKLQAYLVERFPIFQGNFESNLLCKLPFYKPMGNECISREPQNDINSQPVTRQPATLPNLGPAPNFAGINNWLNSEPLTIDNLQDKVVLVDFWTYSCINCIRTLPYLTEWHNTYHDKGLVIVGVHTPEFAFEKNLDNLKTAIKRHNITYPVAQDNDFATWNAYNNHYWPAKYLIDKQGNLRYVHFGEGEYAETEQAIQTLLAEGSDSSLQQDASAVPLSRQGEGRGEGADSPQYNKIRTPEIYFGLQRLRNFAQTPVQGTENYILPNYLKENTYALSGKWNLEDERAVSAAAGNKIKLRFNASKVYMVASSPQPQTIKVTVDNLPSVFLTVSEATLYTLFESNEYRDRVLEIEIPKQDFEAYTFTFG